MVLSDADSLGKAAKEFSEKPFLGASLGTSSAPFIRANFNPKVEWHSSIAPDGKTYQAVKSLICTCIHCDHSMKTGVTQDEDRYKLKQFNPAKYMEHLRKCPQLKGTVREQVLSVGANNGGKRAREEVEEIRKREQEESAQNKQDDPQAKELQSLVKKARTPSDAEKLAEERQQTLDSFVTTDPNVTQNQYNLGMWYLSVFFIMDRIPFLTMDSEYFRKFLKSIRPSFEKMMPSQARKWLAGEGLNQVYAETLDLTTSKLDQTDGLITIGFDGHKAGGRSVLTVSLSKRSICTFDKAIFLKNKRHRGTAFADVIRGYLNDEGFKHKVIAIVADNTSNMRACFDELMEEYFWLFYLGCCVHVLDLLIEDICRILELDAIIQDVHFVVSFIRQHGLLLEEFLIISEAQELKGGLKLFPKTRFAYAYLMAESILKFWPVLNPLVKSTLFITMFDEQQRRTSEEGKTSARRWRKFKRLATEERFFEQSEALVELLVVFSEGLHYLEGDKVPLSHVYPVYAALLTFSQSLPNLQKVKETFKKATLDRVLEIVKERWQGEGQKIGLMHNLHLATFLADYYACCAAPESLHTPEAVTAWKSCLSQVAGGSSGNVQRQNVVMRHAALYSNREGSSSGPWAAVYRGAKDMVESIRKSALAELYQKDRSARQNPVKELLAVLKKCPAPSVIYNEARHIVFKGWTQQDIADHQTFCEVSTAMSSIVGHTAGVERNGKSYGLIMDASRHSIGERRIEQLCYVFNNFPLVSGLRYADPPSFNDFIMHTLDDDERAALQVFFPMPFCLACLSFPGIVSVTRQEALQEEAVSRMARENRLPGMSRMRDAESDSDGEDHNGQEEQEQVDEPDLPFSPGKEYDVVDKTDVQKLDKSLVNKIIYMKWTGYGWAMGKITTFYRNGLILPGQAFRANFTIKWVGERGSRDSRLTLEQYQGGDDAPDGSWVILRDIRVKKR